MISFSAWVKKHLGKGVDYDGQYGVQCVDLVNSFADEVMGVKGCFYGLNYAKEIWTKRNSLPKIQKNFVAIVNTPDFIPRKADIFVRDSGKYGHTGVVDSGTVHNFYAYEQNYNGKHDPMARIYHNSFRDINFLRPKWQYVNANGGLRGYRSMNSIVASVTIPNKTKVEIVSADCGEKKIKGQKYQMQKVKYNGKQYYVADQYFTL